MIFARLFREPFVQFLILGLLVFVVMSVASKGENLNQHIQVSEADVSRLSELWRTQYDRAPSEQELANIVDQFVREEILVREAVAVGLDDGDLIIRRRLAQKYEFLLDGRVDVKTPDEDVLAGWYREHPSRFHEPARVAFRHAFFRADRPGDSENQDALESLTQLQRNDVDWRGVGDPFMMQREFAPRSQREVADVFGEQFAASIFELPEGEWSAPVRSAYGAHAVMVVQRLPEALPAFDSIRERVLADYMERQRDLKREAEFAALRARYVVTIGPDDEQTD